MEALLIFGAPAVMLAAYWWAFRRIRRKQRRGEWSNGPPGPTYGDWALPGFDPTESATAENHIEQIDKDRRPPPAPHRLDDNRNNLPE
ncbi:hypothetical protein [Nocardia otitidiscaviarum]|uniref:Uncharacterized protein n=1 Tax=Nocardia otitidiscaviarum TaxID=1823 RepID=A0A516NFM4_9NOCA|nr:hypothetical protein [Nocardia otitidiscaviarum]MBF6178325.1 hypothetical protein [Nocardia otitidiscaviarum]MCP9623041.1 hypothetical protein [Nocardia otitidiscaviarum]QDP77709.1 hypothetical protein FOH10_02080 [Nocardia otitidiscaviarum]